VRSKTSRVLVVLVLTYPHHTIAPAISKRYTIQAVDKTTTN